MQPTPFMYMVQMQPFLQLLVTMWHRIIIWLCTMSSHEYHIINTTIKGHNLRYYHRTMPTANLSALEGLDWTKCNKTRLIKQTKNRQGIQILFSFFFQFWGPNWTQNNSSEALNKQTVKQYYINNESINPFTYQLL